MGVRAGFGAVLSAVVLLLGGCGGSSGSGGGMTLDEYVKEECAILIDFKGQLQQLTHDLMSNLHNQAALADTVSAMADLYDEMLAKSEKLGDAPNGENVGDEATDAVKSVAKQLHDIASSIRTAKTDSDIQVALSKFQDVVEGSAKQGAELKKKYQTPEIDRAKQAIPGCSDELGA